MSSYADSIAIFKEPEDILFLQRDNCSKEDSLFLLSFVLFSDLWQYFCALTCHLSVCSAYWDVWCELKLMNCLRERQFVCVCFLQQISSCFYLLSFILQSYIGPRFHTLGRCPWKSGFVLGSVLLWQNRRIHHVYPWEENVSWFCFIFRNSIICARKHHCCMLVCALLYSEL